MGDRIAMKCGSRAMAAGTPEKVGREEEALHLMAQDGLDGELATGDLAARRTSRNAKGSSGRPGGGKHDGLG